MYIQLVKYLYLNIKFYFLYYSSVFEVDNDFIINPEFILQMLCPFMTVNSNYVIHVPYLDMFNCYTIHEKAKFMFCCPRLKKNG